MKRRFRLCGIQELENGTRFWFARGGWKHQPATLIARSVVRGVAHYHMVHSFNIDAKRFKTPYNSRVWVEVNKDD